MSKINLNDNVRVVLTEHGAKILNDDGKEMNEVFPEASFRWKIDYKEGDVYENQLWDIIGTFASSCNAGGNVSFTDLEKI